LATAGVLPVLAARYAMRHGLSAPGAALQAGLLVALVCLGVLVALTGWLAPKDAA
jgi:multisubunit Na+/H+ antiporter MnhB subunit